MWTHLCVCVFYGSSMRFCACWFTLAWQKWCAPSWRRSDLWSPTVLITVYVWETPNLPMLGFASPAGLNTHWTHTRMRAHKSLKGTFVIAPFIYKADDWRSVICCGVFQLSGWITLCIMRIFTGWRQLLFHQLCVFSASLNAYILSHWLAVAMFLTPGQ